MEIELQDNYENFEKKIRIRGFSRISTTQYKNQKNESKIKCNNGESFCYCFFDCKDKQKWGIYFIY